MKRIIIFGIKLFVFGGLVFYITKGISLERLGVIFKELNLFYMVLAIACMFLVAGALALRLRYILGAKKVNYFNITIKAYFLNNLMPAQVGGDIYKIFAIQPFIKNRKKILALIFSDRFLGINSLLIISSLNLLIGHEYFTDPRIFQAVLFYFLVIILIYFGIFFLPSQFMIFLERIPKIGKMISKLNQVRKSIQQTIKEKFFYSIVLTVLSYSFLIFVNIFALLSLGFKLNIAASILFIPIIAIAVVTLPISFNGLGLRESLFILFFSMAGYSNEQCLAMALINLFTVLIISITGGVMFVFSNEKISDILHFVKNKEVNIQSN